MFISLAAKFNEKSVKNGKCKRKSKRKRRSMKTPKKRQLVLMIKNSKDKDVLAGSMKEGFLNCLDSQRKNHSVGSTNTRSRRILKVTIISPKNLLRSEKCLRRSKRLRYLRCLVHLAETSCILFKLGYVANKVGCQSLYTVFKA